MTHAELVERAVAWLRSATRYWPVVGQDGRGCSTVVTTPSVMTHELPDAIGWNARGFSTLVECKASRADFLRDTKKWHRRGVGMGYQRYYLAPADLVAADEVPEGWGLLHCSGRRVSVVKVAPKRAAAWAVLEELKHLLAEVRRRDGVVKTLAKKVVAL